MGKQRSGSNLQSVERAIAILKSFSLEKPERGVSELSQEMGLHKSTVSRLMRTLEQGGLLSRNPKTERYRLGLDLLTLAAQVVSYMDIREASRAPLRGLAEACQETVFLSVLDAGEIVNLYQYIPFKHQIKSTGWVDRRMRPHTTAAGKVLMAYLPPDELDLILEAGLERVAPHTITDPDTLRRELSQVRAQGYATAQEELEEGLNAVAAPIWEHTGQVMASIGVAGPAYRVTPSQFHALAAHVIETAMEISRQLGYRPA